MALVWTGGLGRASGETVGVQGFVMGDLGRARGGTVGAGGFVIGTMAGEGVERV